jgi:hypothetical protein
MIIYRIFHTDIESPTSFMDDMSFIVCNKLPRRLGKSLKTLLDDTKKKIVLSISMGWKIILLYDRIFK